MVKTPHFHFYCREHRFNPWSGNEDLMCSAAKKKKKVIWESNISVTIQTLWWKSTIITVCNCYSSSVTFLKDFS